MIRISPITNIDKGYIHEDSFFTRVQIYVKNPIEVGAFYPSLIDSQPASATTSNNEASLVDSQPASLVDP
jgi:hypothetical protein